MPADDAPRAKLDFLYRDVLGEVTKLVERLETVSAELREAGKVRAPSASAAACAGGGLAAKVRAELERSAEMACQRIGAAVQDAARSAHGPPEARHYVVWGAVFLGASLLGGTVVALVLRAP